MSFKIERIGDQIKKFREMRNFTQEHIAKKLEMTPQGYGKIERNEVEITLQKLVTIAGILDTTLQDIFGFDEKFVFHNQECQNLYNSGLNQSVNIESIEKIEKVYEARIADLHKEISYLRNLLEKLASK